MRDVSLLAAAIRGWAMVALGALVVFILVGILRYTGLISGRGMAPAEVGLAALSFGAMVLFTLHAPLLSALILSTLRKFLDRTPGLPVWLAAGIAACLPMALFAWYGFTMVTAHNEGNGEVFPYLWAWTSLQVPLVILACGIIATLVGWRWHRKRLAA